MKFSRLKRRTQIEKRQIDIAPLVSGVFLLFIFFILTSNFVFQPGIQLNLPRAITSEIVSSENFVVTLTGRNLLFLNDKPVTVSELMTHLKEAAVENKSVLLRADMSASVGRVVEIWDLCRELGIPQVNIATNQKSTGARAAP
ncbi:MAG: hypothetical protein COT00_02690 [Candidatus Omnitrophica bacterium CG07_land_8_20_14_0_80_50_8]|nr:MAG: hypothetical protein AUJ71_02580 [Candidatus Omnitrophica bacterium CG1_02_49_16]PIU40242.1 MAG: hypothetical protein COT00_02690 [Candidatus Omnitrophica bacterium CG07_land_8_20_14_0_80_50_8]